MSLLSKLFNFIDYMTKKYSIDESHGLSHSMLVLNYAYSNYRINLIKNANLKDHERIILISALVHDLCDKKYMIESDGIKEIETFLNNEIPKEEIDIIKQIILSMSYSTVKKNGYPNLNEYQLAYHIVREADLLAAINFDRCMIYNMKKMNGNIIEAYNNSKDLFETRILRHREDDLYVTDYAKEMNIILYEKAIEQIINWKQIINLKSLI